MMVRENKPELYSLKKELLLHMKNYIVATMSARKEVCGALKELFDTSTADFYNLSSTLKHTRIIRLLITCLEKYKPHQHLEDAFSVWNSRLAPAVLALSNPVERRKYGSHAKLLAAFLLDSDEYTKAIICLGHVVRLHDDDIHSKLLLTYWLCLLGYWSLAKTQVLHKESMKRMYSLHKEIINEVINDIIHLHEGKTNQYPDVALSVQEHILKTMQCFESLLTESKAKTFQQYEAQILVKRVLIAASHFSSANLALTGDPLQNLDFIKARYETLVKCRSTAYYGSNMKDEDAGYAGFGRMFFSTSGEFQETKIDEYLKLNAVLAEHFKVVLQLCSEYIELGILRESESEGLKLLYQTLKTTNLKRCLAVLNVLFLASTLARGNGVNVRPDPFRPFIASVWNRKSKNEIFANEEKDSEVKLFCKRQEVIDHDENESENPLQGNKENVENKLALEEHNKDCDCVICTLCGMNSQMRVEAIFSKLLFSHCSSKMFRLLSERIQELPQETSSDVIAICSALQKEATDKAIRERRYPLETLDRFLLAAIRWLRRVGQEEKPEIIRDVIKESLKICSTDPIRFRWQWLTIRQLARTPLQFPRLEWMHLHTAPLKVGLRSPLKSIVVNLASELNTLTLCSPKPSLMVTSEICASVSKRNCMTSTSTTLNRTDTEIEEARKDFESFSHLFYREWRFQTCSYLGQVCAFQYKAHWIESGWSAAYYFNEAMFISTRQLARMISKKSSDSQDFHFKTVDKFKEAVHLLPPDLTVVQLFLDSRRILWLIKLYNDRSPLVIPIAFVPQDDMLLRRFLNLLIQNDASGSLNKTCTDPKEYWQIRRKLDKKLKNLICDVETEWFGIFSILLLPSTPMNVAQFSAVNEIVGSGLSRSSANVCIILGSLMFSYYVDESLLFFDLLPPYSLWGKTAQQGFKTLIENLDLSAANWEQLVQRFVALENFNESVATHICDCRSRWISKFGKQPFLRDLSNSYVLFCVSPELASFPFELLPIMESHKRVCRISSFHMFQKLLSRSKKIPKAVDGRNSFYVLDPGGDLTDTQKRLSKELEKFTCWRGTIGAAPKPEELRISLETSDLFFYMGHGSGGKYFGRSAVLRSNVRAVSLLMGCSSVRITHEGEGFDGRGAIYDYVIANCPCVVGCLWMVTDGEIDRVLLALLDFCFSEIQKQNNCKIGTSSSYRLLIDGIAYARTACKLKYMTGGAVVAYGLPIVTHLSQEMIAMKEQSNIEQILEGDTALLNSKGAIEI